MSQQANEVILLDVAGQYNLLAGFLHDIEVAFETLGYRVTRINPEMAEELNYIKKLALMGKAAAQQVKFVFRINYLNAYFKWGDGQNFYDVTGIPLFVWFVDHPCHHIQTVPHDIDNVVVGFVDESHATFWNHRFHEAYVTGFVPHGAGTSRQPHVDNLWSDRPLDVVFFGSYNNPDFLREALISGDAGVNTLVEETFDLSLYDLDLPLHTHFLDRFLTRGIDPFEFGPEILEKLLRQIDFYIRAWRRTRLITAIKDVKLTIYGKGWEAFENAPTNVQFKPDQSFIEAQKTMNQAKIVLNQGPFNRGGHERVFYSMIQGAVCLTDRNRWLQQHFIENDHILYFDYTDPAIINDQVVSALNNPDQLSQVAQRGQAEVIANHTWVQRAQIIDHLVNLQLAKLQG